MNLYTHLFSLKRSTQFIAIRKSTRITNMCRRVSYEIIFNLQKLILDSLHRYEYYVARCPMSQIYLSKYT
jgi:hypothetical protein